MSKSQHGFDAAVRRREDDQLYRWQLNTRRKSGLMNDLLSGDVRVPMELNHKEDKK